MAARAPGQPLHGNRTVAAVPVHADFAPRPVVRFAVQARGAVRSAAGLGIAPPHHTAGAARIERDHIAVLFLAHAHVTFAAHAAEVAAHALDRERHLLPGGHLVPGGIATAPGT